MRGLKNRVEFPLYMLIWDRFTRNQKIREERARKRMNLRRPFGGDARNILMVRRYAQGPKDRWSRRYRTRVLWSMD